MREHYGWNISEDSGIGIKPVSAARIRRLIDAAFQYSIRYGRRSVTLIHKGNIQKFTEGAFRKWRYELTEEKYGDRVITWEEYTAASKEKGADGRILIKDVFGIIDCGQNNYTIEKGFLIVFCEKSRLTPKLISALLASFQFRHNPACFYGAFWT